MDQTSDFSPITTIGGYVAICLLGVLAYSSYTRNSRRNATAKVAARQQRPADADIVSDSKKKPEKAPKQKAKPKAPAAPAVKETAPAAPVAADREDTEAAAKKADREFARQLANAHAGTKFTAKKADDKKAKSVKQSKAEEGQRLAAEKQSASSQAEDADDDLSSQASPAIGAVNGQDVSDMLEPTTAAPSVLRLTDTDSAKPKQQKKAKVAEPVETKKQRQNRKKKEAERALREETEGQRQKLLEQQRRVARVAEGRAAKDGSAFMANQKNAWDEKAPAAAPVQLLDTFDAQPTPKPAPTKFKAPASAVAKDGSDPWMSGVPSEEEQMELLREEDSWNEVKTKKKGKKTAAEQAPAVTVSESATPTPKAQAPSNGTKKPAQLSSSSSFAALTPEGTDDNDDDEQEWDV